MSEKNIIFPAKRDGSLLSQAFEFRGRRPHWRRWGEGMAFLEVSGHTAADAKWVEMSAEEGYEGDKGQWVNKKTMLTLDRAQAEALRDFLNAVLGGSSREARML